MVFFCQNNQWAISEPLERQTRIPLFKRAAGYGFPGVRVDGNDVLAVEAVVTAALDRARRGGGPTLVEAFTYRMGAHTTSDDPTRYRTTAEGEAWKLKDPIERVRAHISRSGIADAAFLAEVDAGADALGEHMRAACRAMPDPVARRRCSTTCTPPSIRSWTGTGPGSTAYLAGFADSGRGH